MKKDEEMIMERTKMKMLRRIKRVTLWDRMRSTDMRKELRVEGIVDKMREGRRLEWYGHCKRKEKDDRPVKIAMVMEVEGRSIGWPMHSGCKMRSGGM